MLGKLKLGASLAALVLFAFPWLDIQCSQKSIVTQTGLQAAFGSGSASAELKALSKELESISQKTGSEREPKDSIGIAPLVLLALIDVFAAVVFSVIAVFRSGVFATKMSSLLPAIALVLLLIQMMVGFPAKHEFVDAAVKDASVSQPNSQFGASMAAARFQSKFSPFLYLELLALSIPSLILANSFIDKHKKVG